MGAIAANADEKQLLAVTEFGRHLGLAFQIVDDLLDVTASPEQMGKATGKDAAQGKNTYPALIGIDQSRSEASRHLSEALASITMLGSRAEPLKTLARFVVEREN
jgi:geranylgeranyl diphosphate synthase type II